MNTLIILLGIVIFLIVPMVYTIGALSCFNEALDDASGNTVTTAEINDLGAFGLFNVSLSTLTVGKVKNEMRKIQEKVATAKQPTCGFMIRTMYFLKNTLMDYIILPFLGLIVIVGGMLIEDSSSGNNNNYNNGYNNNYTGYNNNSNYYNNRGAGLGGSRRRKLKR